MSSNKRDADMVVKSSLKLKRGNLFKPSASSASSNKKKASLTRMEAMAAAATGKAGGVDDGEDLSQIDLTIKRDDEGGANGEVKKTAAELAFQKRQQETAQKRLAKKAAISHREKVERFNKQMEELTEFNDIPKVSWTK